MLQLVLDAARTLVSASYVTVTWRDESAAVDSAATGIERNARVLGARSLAAKHPLSDAIESGAAPWIFCAHPFGPTARPIGALLVGRQGDAFSELEKERLRGLAEVLSIAVEKGVAPTPRADSAKLALLAAHGLELLDALTDMVFVKGEGSRLLWANRAFREAHGLSDEALSELVASGAPGPWTYDEEARVFATGDKVHLPEQRLLVRDDRELNVHTVLTPIKDERGAVTMLVGVARDTSEQKRVQEQLRLTERMASIGQLASGVAHEINNPLSYVMSNITFAQEELGALLDQSPVVRQSKQREIDAALADAKQGAERVRQIVLDLRSFSRKGEEVPGPVDVARALKLALHMASHELRHRARLVTDITPLPALVGHEGRLSQVFLNLLVNAAQAIPAGAASDNEVRVTTSADERFVYIEVSDTGQGMSEDIQKRIFDPYFTTKDIGVGTGLGLSICHSIIKAMGGDITVTSRPGTGSTFRVSLPLQKVEVPATRPRLTNTLYRGRVLVIDDEPRIGQAITQVLAREHDVSVVESGAAALDLLLVDGEWDAILCDFSMPEMNGLELHQRLLARELTSLPGFVLVTGGVLGPRERAYLAQHAIPLLEKPFDAQKLRALLAERVESLRKRPTP